MEYTKAEKEAIERCKELKKDCHKEWIGLSNQVAIDLVLNLIEKQQKEIERLKEDNFRLDRDNQLKFEKAIDTSYYIPKEAIREKLQEYDNKRIKMEKDDIGVGFTLGKEYSDLKAKLQVLKELLGE